MNWLKLISTRLRALFAKEKLDSDMDAEMRSHIELRTQANIQNGMNAEEARLAARLQFGWKETIKENCRDQRGVRSLENLAADIRYAFRQTRKNPGFTTVAALTLALGIGANTMVFSVAKAVLFRPLPLTSPESLMWLRLLNTQTGFTEERLSWRDMEDIRESTQSFEAVALFGNRGAVWKQSHGEEELQALGVTSGLADVLTIRPVLGRSFVPSDEDEGAPPVVMISHELWQARFGGSPDIIGQTLRLDEASRTVVGVLPPGLQFPLEKTPSAGTGSTLNPGLKSFWFPIGVHGEDRVSRNSRMFLPVGRLKRDATEKSARVELAALGKRLTADHPETNRNWSFDLESFRDQILGQTRKGIPMLAFAVAAVLLICCVNLANLLLARGVKRQREHAVRLALGAGRTRLIQTLMTENLLLSILGGGAGIIVAMAGLKAIRSLGSTNVPFVREAGVDGPVIFFTACLSIVTALLFGLLPALWQSRIGPSKSLGSGTRTTGGPQIRRWQQGLLAGQIAIVLALLASAALLLESFRRLIGQDLGYNPRSVIALDLKGRGFESNELMCRAYRALIERLKALPGVEAVGTISSVPLTGKWTFSEKPLVVGTSTPEAERPSLEATFIAFDYFKAMGIPLLDGRFFRDSELNDNGYGQAIVLNQAAAQLVFPGRSAVGGKFTVGSNPDRILEVIGVVQDTRDVRLDQNPPPRFYWQYAFGGAQVVVRSQTPSRRLNPFLLDAIRQTDSRFSVVRVQPMTEIITDTVAERRFLMSILSFYAAIALGVMTLGIFGVVAYQVAQRTNEFGIRLALGANSGGLMRLVILQTGRVVAIGLAIGLTLSFVAARLLSSQVFGLSPHNPILLASVSTLLLLFALLACFLPARRAAKVNPMEALRHE